MDTINVINVGGIDKEIEDTVARASGVSADSRLDILEPKVTAEITDRTTADASLQAQIDQFVAPTGTAPNPAEIENARIGADNVTYETLGEAIRTQFTDLVTKACVVNDALPAETDLDSLYLNGWYRVSTQTELVNTPDGNIGRRIIFVYSAKNALSTSARFMIYINTGSIPCFAFRSFTGSVWNDWRVLPTEDTINELIEYVKRMVYGDYLDYLTNGEQAYWGTDGVKHTSSYALCTAPIFVRAGYGLQVSTGIGNSAYGVTEVTVDNAFIGGVSAGSCENYIFVFDHDAYISISSYSTQLPDLVRKINVLRPEEINDAVDYNKTISFSNGMRRYGYYTDSGEYKAHQNLQCVDFPVNAGDLITADLVINSNKYGIYVIYDDNTSEGVVGVSDSEIKKYQKIAVKDGRCYLSSYILQNPNYTVNSITDMGLNKRLCSIFKKVVCCGDSYTSGWIDDGDGNGIRNNPGYNFPHYMSLLTGNDWVDCGASGTTSLTWQTNINGYHAAKAAGNTQAYVVGLGINDKGSVPLGTPADIGTDAQTYYGGISQIIIKLAAISPDAKIFVNTNPNSNDSSGIDEENEALRIIVETMKNNYHVHLIDLAVYALWYHKSSVLMDSLSGHFTAIGYEQFAEIYARILSLYIMSHISDFQDVAFIPYEELSEGAIDYILTDNNAVAITTTATSCNVYGKYFSFDGQVYYKMVIFMTSDIESSISDMGLNLPIPEDDTVLYEKTQSFIKQKPHIRYNSSKWMLGGIVSPIDSGKTAVFYGKYIVS